MKIEMRRRSYRRGGRRHRRGYRLSRGGIRF